MSEKRVCSLVLLILAVSMVLFFTFQNPEDSKMLSETVRAWLGNIGIRVEYTALRSNIHILEYFVVGLAVCAFLGKRWIKILIGCGIGMIDEGIKVLLPGREFSSRDLIKDFLGILLAIMIVEVILEIVHNRKNNNTNEGDYGNV